jgi:hypothetical protein
MMDEKRSWDAEKVRRWEVGKWMMDEKRGKMDER